MSSKEHYGKKYGYVELKGQFTKARKKKLASAGLNVCPGQKAFDHSDPMALRK
jgi:hypothetical protein